MSKNQLLASPGPHHKDTQEHCREDDSHVNGQVVLKGCPGKDVVKIDGVGQGEEPGGKAGEMRSSTKGGAVGRIHSFHPLGMPASQVCVEKVATGRMDSHVVVRIKVSDLVPTYIKLKALVTYVLLQVITQ